MLLPHVRIGTRLCEFVAVVCLVSDLKEREPLKLIPHDAVALTSGVL